MPTPDPEDGNRLLSRKVSENKMKILFSQKEVNVRRRKSAHPGMNQEWVIDNPDIGKGERRLQGRYERIGSKILFLSADGVVFDVLASEKLIVNRGKPFASSVRRAACRLCRSKRSRYSRSPAECKAHRRPYPQFQKTPRSDRGPC